VVKLVQVKFPELIDHLIPLDAPVEVAARMVRASCEQKLNLTFEEIGIWFITPCAAKMTAVRQPLGVEKSDVTGTIAMSQIYGSLLKVIATCQTEEDYSTAGADGLGWALSGGETNAVQVQKALVVHEIHSVSEVLEQVALGKLNDVDYIEALACAGGCIGGPLVVENRFVAEHNMRRRLEKLQSEERSTPARVPVAYPEITADERRTFEPRSSLKLDEDIVKAMNKLELMQATLLKLPGLDCGSCGSPNCQALAEDIVQGMAREADCIFKLRERVRDLAKEMVDLAEKLPPSMEQTGQGREGGEGI